MSRGIYIIANDKVLEHSIALIKSIRLYDDQVPIVMIPYDKNYSEIYKVLSASFGVTLFNDTALIERLEGKVEQIFGKKFFARPNQFRKQCCWFGAFDEFLYIDTDIVVFEKISDNLNYLKDFDFICCDYQHKGGVKNVFSENIAKLEVFTESELDDIFNCGFWGSKKGLFSEEDLYKVFHECASHPEYFDFSQKTSDQPIINYMILKRVRRRFNIVRKAGGAPGNWAGSTGFVQVGEKLVDPKRNIPLQYLHWAGIKIEPGAPYWDIWEHYRYLGEDKPLSKPRRENFWKRLLIQLKRKLRPERHSN